MMECEGANTFIVSTNFASSTTHINQLLFARPSSFTSIFVVKLKQMQYIEAPDTQVVTAKHKVFLAGGIRNCPRWQVGCYEELDSIFNDTYACFNPYRKNWQECNEVALEQIEWEHARIAESDVIIFNFLPPTLNPMTLFEFGKMLLTDKRLFVRIDPCYARRFDLVHQVRLERPDVKLHDNWKELIDEFVAWVNTTETQQSILNCRDVGSQDWGAGYYQFDKGGM